ncbi:hypothetical protein VPH35_028342 [Triticum aestivum]
MDMPGEDEYVYGYEYEFDLENPFTSPADEPIASLLDAEAHHAPSVSAAASAVRRDAARFISKVRYDGELAVHPRVAYLALNYVDRFLSKGQLPFERKPWAPRLLAISCLSIAAKMQRVDAISMDYIQRDEEFMFDAVTIRRMERVVLGALEWRARSVTPLAFLGFFLSACFPPPRHPALLDAVKERAVDLLLRAQPGTSARSPGMPMPSKPERFALRFIARSTADLFPSCRGEDGGVLAVRGGRVGAAGRRRRDRRRPPPRLPSRRGRLPLCK